MIVSSSILSFNLITLVGKDRHPVLTNRFESRGIICLKKDIGYFLHIGWPRGHSMLISG
jgi:hypothetical protein